MDSKLFFSSSLSSWYVIAQIYYLSHSHANMQQVNYLIGDGKSHWLEGVLLMMMYLIIALAAWYAQNFRVQTDPHATYSQVLISTGFSNTLLNSLEIYIYHLVISTVGGRSLFQVSLTVLYFLGLPIKNYTSNPDTPGHALQYTRITICTLLN